MIVVHGRAELRAVFPGVSAAAAVSLGFASKTSFVQKFEALKDFLFVPGRPVEAKAHPRPVGPRDQALRCRCRCRTFGPSFETRFDF